MFGKRVALSCVAVDASARHVNRFSVGDVERQCFRIIADRFTIWRHRFGRLVVVGRYGVLWWFYHIFDLFARGNESVARGQLSDGYGVYAVQRIAFIVGCMVRHAFGCSLMACCGDGSNGCWRWD